MEQILKGKVAIITGSGQGVGREIALCFAAHGAKVITNNRKPGSSIQAFEGTELNFTPDERAELLRFNGDAQTVADEITAAGGEALPVYGDVSKREDAKRMVDAAIEKWGRVDIIVNNASSNWTGSILDMDPDIFDTQIASKLNGSFYLMHYAMPHMKEQGFGRIINTASDAIRVRFQTAVISCCPDRRISFAVVSAIPPHPMQAQWNLFMCLSPFIIHHAVKKRFLSIPSQNEQI